MVPMNCTNDLKILDKQHDDRVKKKKKKKYSTALHFEVCKILCHYHTLNGMTSCKNARCKDNTLFPLLGHTLGGKSKSYLMVGLSKSFKLLATRGGPTESGYNYAMEKRAGKAGANGREEKRRALFKRMERAGWENLPL